MASNGTDIGARIAERIKQRRMELGLSQSAVADALDAPLRTYQAWEKDFVSSVQNLMKIGSFFDISLEQLVASADDGVNAAPSGVGVLPFKRRFFRMAADGAPTEEIFAWYRDTHPDDAESVSEPSRFVENCLLDVYHNDPSLLAELHFSRVEALEHAVAERFHLPASRVTVVDSDAVTHEALREMIIAPWGAQTLIDWATAKPGLRVGISNGFTVARILDAIPRGRIQNLNLFPLSFTGTEVDFPISASALISSFLYRSAGYGVNSDTVTEEQVMSSMLLADAALLGIGSFAQEGLYERMICSVLGRSVVNEIRAHGVVGDLNYHLFDADGNEAFFPEVVTGIGRPNGTDTSSAMIKSIGLTGLRDRAERGARIVIAATGRHKAQSVSIALEHGYANHLVTDTSIATTLA